MAAHNNFVSNTESRSVASLIKCTIRKELVKNLLCRSSKQLMINNGALDEIAEVANCIVIETCMRAACQAKQSESSNVTDKHVQQCLHQLMLDFP